ncbi:MAG: hypothetical protein ACRD16_15620, partial [Thermoanaerobaculia bacterium]
MLRTINVATTLDFELDWTDDVLDEPLWSCQPLPDVRISRTPTSGKPDSRRLTPPVETSGGRRSADFFICRAAHLRDFAARAPCIWTRLASDVLRAINVATTLDFELDWT